MHRSIVMGNLFGKNNVIASKTCLVFSPKPEVYLAVDVPLQLFHTLVLPVLLYGCKVWGFKNIDLCEKLPLKFCRYVFHVKSSEPNFMIYGELGRFPVMYSLFSRMVGFWANIVCWNRNKISFKLYQIIKKFPRLKKVKTILQNVGLWNERQSEIVPSKNGLSLGQLF